MSGLKTNREFVLVYMLEPVSIGTRFTMWPLHLTLLPWFDAPDEQSVISGLQSVLKGLSPVKTHVTQRAHFGQRKLPVMLLNNTTKLQQLHDTLLKVINNHGWPLNGRYTGSHFKPHITSKHGNEASGEIVIDRIYIFEKQGQNYREAVGVVEMST